MKFLLKYNYNLEKPTISRIDKKNFFIKNNHNKYIFQCIDSRAEAEFIVKMLDSSYASSVFHRVEKSVFGNYIINYRNQDYILLKVVNNECKSNDIMQIIMQPNKKANKLKKSILDRSNWFFLWCKKNDHIHENISHNKRYEFINESYDYYMGLAECAIAYLNNARSVNGESNLYITYKRISSKELNNPFNVVVDKKERDIAEYIKYLFISHQPIEEKTKNIIYIIKKQNLSIAQIYARLLYPTYFFDLCEEIINENKREEELIAVVKRNNEYEQLLLYIYITFSKIAYIKKIDWL